MSEISAQLIKQLRERTGVGMGKCKEALVLAQGDLEKAVDVLRKKGMAAAVKKEGREVKEGVVLFAQDQEQIDLLEVNAETDFVVNNARFQEFAKECIDQAMSEKVTSLEALLASNYPKDPTLNLDQYRNLVIQALGENIQLQRLEVIHKKQNSSYGIYSHMGGKIVVVVEVEGSSDQEDLARDIAMHIAAESPEYVRGDEIPANVLAKEEEIARSQVSGKPENIIDKIVAGKINAYKAQVCLLSQPFVKDSSVSVEQYVENASKKLGKTLHVKCFWRWKVGQ